jgi:hypothetical protein
MYRRTVIVTVAMSLALVALAVLAQSVFGMAGWWAVLGIGLLASGAFEIALNRNPAFRDRVRRVMAPGRPPAAPSDALRHPWPAYVAFFNAVLFITLAVMYAVR